ncbi:MAG TPA: MarC family protein, partial [Casimicrobiaceae bacterium]
MKGLPEVSELLGLWTVFILLFVTLGPIKVFGPFMQLTHDADEAMTKRIALRAFALAVIAAVAGGFVGMFLVQNWQISQGALTLAGGVIFLLVGLSLVLEQYKPEHATPAPL